MESVMVLKYDITSGGHFQRGLANLELFQKANIAPLLFYTALEFRCCIERLLIEYLGLMYIEDIPKRIEKIYRVKELKNEILSIEPRFIKKLEFINIYFEALNLPYRTSILDLDLLNEFYGKVGQYVHSNKYPEKTSENSEWWSSFLELLDQIQKHLYSILNNSLADFNFNQYGWEIFESFDSGEFSKDELIEKIKADTNKWV